jgi:RNA-directed DNA polymerase
VSKEIFSKLDDIVWNMLWKWAKRRHHNKSKSWIANKYWHSKGTRKWVFSTESNILKRFSDTKIVRHISLKLDKNPYLNKEYFDQRRFKLKINKTNIKPNSTVLNQTSIEDENCRLNLLKKNNAI